MEAPSKNAVMPWHCWHSSLGLSGGVRPRGVMTPPAGTAPGRAVGVCVCVFYGRNAVCVWEP